MVLPQPSAPAADSGNESNYVTNETDTASGQITHAHGEQHARTCSHMMHRSKTHTEPLPSGGCAAAYTASKAERRTCASTLSTSAFSGPLAPLLSAARALSALALSHKRMRPSFNARSLREP